MKKSLLALAVLGAFAGAASAQTNVTIYGVVDAAVTRVDDERAIVDGGTGGETQWSLTDANSSYNKNGSRIGFKGSEDLGGGLSAIFTLENGFNVDNGRMGQDNRLFGRQAWVGLQGSFGAVKLGRQYTPMHLALDTIDPFGTGMAGNITNLFNNAGTRTDNTVNYSYSAAGFSGQVAYSLGEQTTGTSDGRQLGLGLGYANGPLNVQFAYHDANGTVTAPADIKIALLGATYDLGAAKIHAAFQTEKDDADDSKFRNFMVGVSAPVGAGEIRASYLRSDDRNDAEFDKADQFGLGYVHNLSKRTNLYTSFAYAKAKVEGADDVKANIFNVGVQHKF